MARCNGVFVHQKENESADSLLKRFKQKVKQSKILQQKLNSGIYFKPSVKKRKKNKTHGRNNENQ